nr:hypothetical protein Itr_chr01CG11790 [Ipomoea trifida]
MAQQHAALVQLIIMATLPTSRSSAANLPGGILHGFGVIVFWQLEFIALSQRTGDPKYQQKNRTWDPGGHELDDANSC